MMRIEAAHPVGHRGGCDARQTRLRLFVEDHGVHRHVQVPAQEHNLSRRRGRLPGEAKVQQPGQVLQVVRPVVLQKAQPPGFRLDDCGPLPHEGHL
eukprot:CAMPEP_0181514682 /NCGR_PEP_ID=MMETSP1110-20121109/63163_1 /TAXON_ID=174948 /ORGANISM="Symbiodinium sp., Strain CCMP421" /LENGTH=95 /DNA_ID=CAMNT_0023644633 /DNA_START=200 /DNA_END=487 /DNA_ORIENTATION=+